jgi:hypothetical protein
MAPVLELETTTLLHVLHRRATVAERLTPNDEQKLTLYVLLAYVVGITILWNLWLFKYALYPWKVFTVLLHEFCHAAAGWCTGARIVSIEVDPNQGGLTRMKGETLVACHARAHRLRPISILGGAACWTLPAGYLGSGLLGVRERVLWSEQC